MGELQFRIASVHDAAAIAKVVNAAYRPVPGAGGWTHESALIHGNRTDARQVAALMADSTVMVGERGSKVVACVHVELAGPEAHIGMLAVDPALQAGGIGKSLLAHAEEYASARGAQEYVLTVIGARTELIAFYLRRGYKRTGKRLAFPPGANSGTPLSSSLELEVLRKHSRPSPQTQPPC
ncbi:MAG: GNAT family N-acetyltransferase [Lentisphaeria bacterium]